MMNPPGAPATPQSDQTPPGSRVAGAPLAPPPAPATAMATATATAQPSPPNRTRPRRVRSAWRRRSAPTKVLIVVTAVIVVAAAGVGVYYVSGEQRRDYNRGHAAYLEGDCTGAVGPLREAADSDTDDTLAATARSELDECEALSAADALDTQGRHGEAVLAYSAFVTTYAASPIVGAALSRGQTLVSEAPAERLATGELCDAVDVLDAQGFVTAPDVELPPLLLACGDAYTDAGDYGSAIAVLERIRTDYAESPLIPDVEAAYARAALADADRTGAGTLAPPSVVGATGTGDGPATVAIRNSTSEPLTIVFHGPTQTVQELPACEQCDAVSAQPDACPEGGPVGQYELPPGTYDVVVRATGSASVLPFRGSWALVAGQQYSTCFYLGTR